jgi:prophage regulatory protein
VTKTILRLPRVKAKTGLSRSTIYDKVQKKQFPAPVKLGDRAVGWVESEIDGWLDQCIEARPSVAS